jgi:hypothetical protein
MGNALALLTVVVGRFAFLSVLHFALLLLLVSALFLVDGLALLLFLVLTNLIESRGAVRLLYNVAIQFVLSFEFRDSKDVFLLALAFHDLAGSEVGHGLAVVVGHDLADAFRNFVAVRNLVSLAALPRNLVTVRHCYVMAFLFRNVLAIFAVVVRRLALFAIVGGAFLLLFLSALFFVNHLALLLLFKLASVSEN